jgi:hypothetical protein
VVRRYKRMGTRLEAAESVLIGRRKIACPVCGKEDAVVPIVFEHHELDGSVRYGPEEPCPGCAEIEFERDPQRIFSLIICEPHVYGLSCRICKETYGENAEELRIRRERYKISSGFMEDMVNGEPQAALEAALDGEGEEES